LSDQLKERIRNEAGSIARLSSDEKVALYREHGAVIGERVTIGRGTLIDAAFVEVPATVVKRAQRADLDPAHRAAVVREIFEGNSQALAVLGWTLEPDAAATGGWAGTLTGLEEARVVVEGRRISVGDTVFDLDARTVCGRRNGGTDVIRHLLFKYGHVFEPRLWRFRARLEETTY
jgi:hypothetical protein